MALAMFSRKPKKELDGGANGGSVFAFRDVSKIYPMGDHEVRALWKVNLDVVEGDYMAILGPSGSGKSTLMHIMGFMDHPTSGDVYVDGENVTRAGPRRRAILRRTKIGFVFQSFNLLPRLSVLENVVIPMLYHYVRGRKSRQRAAEVLDMVGLGDRLHHMPGQLSGGQRQRVAIARALVNNPRVILADEPTGNLDSKSAATILELLEELNSKGHTVLVVTHDPNIASRAARKVLVSDGQVENEVVGEIQLVQQGEEGG